MSLCNDTNTTMLVQPYNNGYGNSNSGMWGGDWGAWIVLFLIFGLFSGNWGGFGGGFGGGYGAQQGYDTRAEIQRGFDTSEVFSKLNGLENGLCDGFYAVNTAFGTLTNNMNQNTAQLQNSMNQGFNGLNTAIVSQGYESRLATQGVQAQLADCCCNIKGEIKDNTTQGVMNTSAIQAAIKDCCCENEKIALNAQYTSAQQNCATIQAIDKLGDRLEARLTAQELAAKDAQIAAQNQQIFAYQLKASQSEQTQQLQQYVNGQFVYYNPRPVPSFNVPAQYPYCTNAPQVCPNC